MDEEIKRKILKPTFFFFDNIRCDTRFAKIFCEKKKFEFERKKKIPFLYRHNTFEELLALLVKKKFFFFDSREKRKSDRNAI